MADENEEFFVKTSNCNYSSLDMFLGTSVAWVCTQHPSIHFLQYISDIENQHTYQEETISKIINSPKAFGEF